MTSRARWRAAAAWLSLVLLLAADTARALPAAGVLNFPDAPFNLRAVAEPSGSPAGLVDVAFRFHNTGKFFLEKIGVQVAVFTAGGEPRGYFIVHMPVNARPGVESYARAGIANFMTLPGDRAVLLPYSAEGGGFRWQRTEGQNRRILRALVNARGDASQLDGVAQEQVTAQNPTPPTEDPYGGICSLCQNAPSSCKEFCNPCYAGGYSCSCQTQTVTCTCGKCPGQ